MNSVFHQMRMLDVSEQNLPNIVTLEIIAAPSPEKNLFIILDFSDSAKSVLTTLKKISWVWRLLPPHWKVALYALSNPKQIYPAVGFTFVRDVIAFFDAIEESPFVRSWIDYHRNRGSFLQPVLDTILNRPSLGSYADGCSISESLVLIITDGELLDPDPINIPGNIICLGIHSSDMRFKKSDWSAVLMHSMSFDVESFELKSLFNAWVYPGRASCQVIAGCDCIVEDDRKLKLDRGQSISWNFSEKALRLAVDVSLIGNQDAYFDIFLDDKRGSRINLVSNSGVLGSKSVKSDETATIANGQLLVISDVDVVECLLAELRRSADNRELLSSETIELITACVNKDSELDSAIVVAINHCEKPETKVLIVSIVYKDAAKSLVLRKAASVPEDPGFGPKRDIRVQYSIETARWQLFVGDERSTLPPRACCMLRGIFFDREGAECEVFFTGPLRRRGR
jgi:hypothetical protein